MTNKLRKTHWKWARLHRTRGKLQLLRLTLKMQLLLRLLKLQKLLKLVRHLLTSHHGDELHHHRRVGSSIQCRQNSRCGRNSSNRSMLLYRNECVGQIVQNQQNLFCLFRLVGSSCVTKIKLAVMMTRSVMKGRRRAVMMLSVRLPANQRTGQHRKGNLPFLQSVGHLTTPLLHVLDILGRLTKNTGFRLRLGLFKVVDIVG